MKRSLERVLVSLCFLVTVSFWLQATPSFAANQPQGLRAETSKDPVVTCASFDSIGQQSFGLVVSLVAAPNPVGFNGTVTLEDIEATVRIHSNSELAFLYESQAPSGKMSVAINEDLTVTQGGSSTQTTLPFTLKGTTVIPSESSPLDAPGFSVDLAGVATSFKATAIGTTTIRSAQDLAVDVSVPDASAPLNEVKASCSETPEVLASVQVQQCAPGEVPSKNSLGQATCVKVTGKPDAIEELGTKVTMSAASLGVLSKDVLDSSDPPSLDILSSGELHPVLVFSTNGTLAGWTVTGEMEGPFVNQDSHGNGADNAISPRRLSWTPFVSAVVNGKLTGRALEVEAGKEQALSDQVPHRLCYAPAGGGGGEFACSAKLSLRIPPWVASGTYVATLNLVLTVY
jgi:hypothetical protein